MCDFPSQSINTPRGHDLTEVDDCYICPREHLVQQQKKLTK